MLIFFSFQDDGHSDWVSCVRFSPNHANPIIVSAGWDRMVKVSEEELILKVIVKNYNVLINEKTTFIDVL